MKSQNIEQFLKENKTCEGPMMIYDLKQLEINIKNVIEYEKKYNIKFLFPVKSFPEKKIIKLFAKYNFGFDVANNNEYNFIKKYAKDNIISFSGINCDCENLNSKNIFYYLNTTNNLNNKQFNGLRINPSQNKTFFSKFGITIEELIKANFDCNKIKSLGFHFYEDNKQKKQKVICQLYKKIKMIFPNLESIDIGGNWDVLDTKQLEETLICLRKKIDYNIKIFLEVGENWFNNCGYLLAKIIDINNVRNKKIYYINAVRECVAKWSVLKPINLRLGNKKNKVYIISGCSCYEKDVFYISQNKINLDIGDTVIFSGLNGYSYAWKKEFNGSEVPEVVFYE